MDRASCPHCEKQFKKQSGLDYHLGWAHKAAHTGHPPMDGNKDGFDQPIDEALFSLLEVIYKRFGQLAEHLNGDEERQLRRILAVMLVVGENFRSPPWRSRGTPRAPLEA